MLSDGSGTAHDGSISREHLRRRVLTAGRILRTDGAVIAGCADEDGRKEDED